MFELHTLMHALMHVLAHEKHGAGAGTRTRLSFGWVLVTGPLYPGRGRRRGRGGRRGEEQRRQTGTGTEI